MATTIYTDSETLTILEKIKQKDPDFNLSAFIKNALINYHGGSVLDLAEIEKRKGEVNIKMKELENEIKYWDAKVLEYMMQQESIKEEEYEKRRKRDELAEKENYKKKVVSETFLDEMGRKITEAEYLTYKAGLEAEKYRNVWSFIEDMKKSEKLKGG